MLKYCVGRGMDVGPAGPDFGSACDQMDLADVLLARFQKLTNERHIREVERFGANLSATA